jgi:outer membrane lipoprotein SlyB
MKANLMKGAIVAAALAASGAAHAQSYYHTPKALDFNPSYSETKRTECTTSGTGVPGWLGQALGGVVGAGIGSQIGKGRGNSAAAAAGAVLGSQAGAAMSGNGQSTQTCREVIDRTLDGYILRTEDGYVFVPLDIAQRLANGH